MIPCILLSSSFSLPPQWAHTLLLSSKPNPSPSPACPLSSLSFPVHARCFLCRSRRRDSSLDPNAESVRTGRFRSRDESGGGEVGGDFGQGGSRRWWSDGIRDDDFKEEVDSFDDGDDDGEQLWDKIWIFKVLGCISIGIRANLAAKMAEKGKEPVSEGVRNIETLWANQANIERQLEALSTDVQRLTIEMRREFNLYRARNPPHQTRRNQVPAVAPDGHRGMGLDRQGRRRPQVNTDVSDSENECQIQQEGTGKYGLQSPIPLPILNQEAPDNKTYVSYMPNLPDRHNLPLATDISQTFGFDPHDIRSLHFSLRARQASARSALFPCEATTRSHRGSALSPARSSTPPAVACSARTRLFWPARSTSDLARPFPYELNSRPPAASGTRPRATHARTFICALSW
ncbi:hypothetical protein M5K25_010370 [Dendrobium thyrsiflorum]|uniref:Uncharacterized protein n=1 Tax=Dendrobium thyrsiflorum TaxID=117978 RepID=A0ABD0V6X2_DENTH